MPTVTRLGTRIAQALTDKKIDLGEVDGFIKEAMSNKKLSAAEKKELRDLFFDHGKKFSTEAKEALAKFLGIEPKPPTTPTTPTTPVVADTFQRTKPIAADAIETVFTPGDDARLMEYAALDEVIAARKADPKTYPAESNPYRIEYAVYNLTDKEVVRKLTEASQAGVFVQVLVDAKSIGPSKWWSTLVKDLTAAGFSYAKSQRGLTAEQQRTTQLIGIDMPGIFHLKSRVFAYPDPATGQIKETLLTGSYNPETAARNNDESLHKITDQHLVDQYQRAIAAMRDGQPVVNSWDPNCPVNAIFTAPSAQGPRPIDKILDLVKAEQEFIGISVFTLRDLTGSDKTKLIQQLKEANARGVPVVVITDRKQSDSVDAKGNPVAGYANDKTDELLQAAGIPVYECINPAGDFNAMHLKSAIFGLKDMKVVTDAGNWTYSGMGSGASGYSMNCESLLFIDSGKLDKNETGERYLGEFMKVLRKYGEQSPDQPAPEVLLAQLQKLPNWPTVKVDFSVVAKTHFGQDVYIVGNTEELGGWGEGGPGLKLETDASTYPNWRSATVEVPLGTRFEYKVVKRGADGKLDWEAGQNAILIADPIKDPDHDRIQVSDAFNGDG